VAWRNRRGIRRVVATSLILLFAMLAGCTHKLVAHNGDTTVDVYSNKDQFDKVKSMKSEGGAAGIFGGIGESMLAKKIPSATPVKILSSDEEGSMIEVMDGPEKGLQGYVAKDNLD
jgi:hypothetical protein